MLYGTRTGLSLLVLSTVVASTAVAQEFDWRKHEGTTIHGITFNNPGINAYIKPLMDQFEEETGHHRPPRADGRYPDAEKAGHHPGRQRLRAWISSRCRWTIVASH